MPFLGGNSLAAYFVKILPLLTETTEMPKILLILFPLKGT